MNGVVHFEIPVDDLERARAFYAIFGWDLQDYPMPDGSKYIGMRTVPVDEKTRMPKEVGAINGGMMLRTKQVQSPVFAINVASIDAMVKKIENAGGSVVKPKVDVMGMGFYAYVKDTEGNVVGLWEDAKKNDA